MLAFTLIGLSGLAAATPNLLGERNFVDYTFTQYISEFSKVYDTADERNKRAAIFAANHGRIVAHNAKPRKTWYMTVNEFTDLTNEEFKKQRTGRMSAEARAARLTETKKAPTFHTPIAQLPDEIDWRDTEGVVTKVKNQGSCGSCWAFSAAESLESAAAIASGEAAPVLAPQQLVSCSPNPKHCGGTGGCDGSTQELAFSYTETAGLSLETAYPYTAKTGTCKTDKIVPVVKNEGFVHLPKNNYSALISAVATIGPISISIAASSFEFSAYGGGVFNSDGCGWVEDHAVQLVGYGATGGIEEDYWIVRNSWGTGWGDGGYMYLRRYGDGKEPCGTDDKPGDGDACEGDTKPIKLCGLCGVLSDSSYPTGVKLVKQEVVEEEA